MNTITPDLIRKELTRLAEQTVALQLLLSTMPQSNGVASHVYERTKTVWDETRMAELKSLIAKGLNSREAATTMGTTPSCVRAAASKHGISFRKTRK